MFGRSAECANSGKNIKRNSSGRLIKNLYKKKSEVYQFKSPGFWEIHPESLGNKVSMGTISGSLANIDSTSACHFKK